MENILWGFIYLLFKIISLISNDKLYFTTDHHLNFWAHSVRLIWLYFNTKLVFKDVDVKSLIKFIRFHTLMRVTHLPVPNRQTRNLFHKFLKSQGL